MKKLIQQGKVKDIYDIGNGKLLFEFSDRVSAFDLVLPSKIPEKGEVLCRLSAFWFRNLEIPNHMLEIIPPNQMVVKKTVIIPIECVVRGYLYGSLFARVKRGEVQVPVDHVLATKFLEPLFDPTTKFEEKDRPITKAEILNNGWLTEENFEWLKQKSIELYQKMVETVNTIGFILADIKFEFGRDSDGTILLADSIGPDEFRLWSKDAYAPGKAQFSFDKQVVRDWLIEVGYKAELDEAITHGYTLPKPPELPKEIIEITRERYIHVFEQITGESFR